MADFCSPIPQNEKHFLPLYGLATDIHILDESVSLLTFVGNLVNSKVQGEAYTFITCFVIYHPKYISASVGYCLFVLGLTRASDKITKNLTLSFVIKYHSWGWGG